MPQNDIKIHHIKVKDLEKYAEQTLSVAKTGDFIPITMQRAVSHARNPYADGEDVALLVAVDEEDDIVGFFGIMPMRIRIGDRFAEAHWFTTWSVSAKVRGQGVGSRLMAEALRLDQDYLIVGSIHARRVCRKYGFLELPILEYFWLDATGMKRLNPLVWIRRAYRKFNHLLGREADIQIHTRFTDRIDRWLAPLTRPLIYRFLSRKHDPILNEIQVREVDRLEKPVPTGAHHPEIEMHRGIEAVNWMVEYPWVVGPGESITEEMEYYFSDTRPLYKNILLEVSKPEDEYLGYVVFSISGNGHEIKLKTLDYRFTIPGGPRYVLALALQYARRVQADTIELPREAALCLRGRLLERFLLHRRKRIYQCMPREEDSPLDRIRDKITLHLYDGDMAFS